MVFGRLATQLAKKAISGEEVHLINAEKMVLRGNPASIKEKYLMLRRIKHKGTPEKSPHWPRVPHLLVKRMIRGMVPHKTARGREAMRRLLVYTGNPRNLESNLALEKSAFSGDGRSMTILELCKSIGYSG